MEEFRKDLDEWMDYYNNHRTHQENVLWQNADRNIRGWEINLG